MEAVTDKLKLLSYEKALVRARGLSPLPAAYFTGAAVGTVEGEQLEYLYALVCWLLDISVLPRHELWALLPRARSPTHDADANAACAALLAALRRRRRSRRSEQCQRTGCEARGAPRCVRC